MNAIDKLYDRLQRAEGEGIPVYYVDRHVPLTELAKLVRKVFGALDLRGISVRSPRYSGAHAVVVELPQVDEGFEFAGVDYSNESWSAMPDGVRAKALSKKRERARQIVEKILDAAFPHHRDRSEGASDFWDYKFSVQ